MAPFVNIFGRDAAEATVGSSGITVVGLIGFCVAAVVILGLLVWVSVKVWRKRQQKKREDARGAAFLTVKGVVKESISSTGPLPADLLGLDQGGAKGFSRTNITASIVLPDKAIIRPGASREEVLSYYEEQGTLPRPFAPFSFALNAAHGSAGPQRLTPSRSSSDNIYVDNRVSTLSFSASAARLQPPSTHTRGTHSRGSSVFSALGSARSSVLSTASSAFSMFSSGGSSGGGTGVQQRRVRQLFTPILPDEPTLSLGERVSIVRAFDDGWCVVARPRPYGGAGEVELGAVPAWCFVKPLKGLRSERPVRASSLGVTVCMDDGGDGVEKPRSDYISWSNF